MSKEMKTSGTTVLEIEGLTKKFGEFVAVNNVSLSVEEGELYAIIGPNGAGKTTTFNMLTGALTPTSGSIRYRGQRIESSSEHERARAGIVRAFQMAQLFPEQTVLENVRLAAQARHQSINPLLDINEDDLQKAKEVLEDMAINVPLDEKAKNISHGDKKKLEIAMCIVTDPDILLLDEPTSGVSEAETRWIINFIEDISEDVTVLLIEHNIDMVLELSDTVTVLSRGEVLATGSPEEITNNEAVQDAYMGGKSE